MKILYVTRNLTLLALIFLALLTSACSNRTNSGTASQKAQASEPDFTRYSIRGIHLGMNEAQVQKTLGLNSPALVKTGFAVFCLECGGGPNCGHPPEKSGTVLLSEKGVEDIFGAHLEKDGKVVILLGDSRTKVLQALGEPQKREDEGGQMRFEYRRGDDHLLFTFGTLGVDDIYLYRKSQDGQDEPRI